MKLSNALAAVVATSIATAPIAAQAAVAEVEQARVGSDVEGENLAGGFIIPLIALVAVVLGILAATSDSDDDLPTSP
jgi:Na+/H+-dicarboxylate symporter